MSAALEQALETLAAGSRAHAARTPAARAALARDTARAVATVAPRWVEAATTLKRGGARPTEVSADPAMTAEETATGPLATIRLLLLTAAALDDVARGRPPGSARPPTLLPAGQSAGGVPLVGVDVLPARGVGDAAVFRGHSAVVRCVDPGGLEAFHRSWLEESQSRPRAGGVAAVLGAGNVTGLAPADAVAQIFEHGRAALVKLHPLHATLEPILREALGPLVAADLLRLVTGGPELAAAAVASRHVTHVHLTGGRPAFDALVWGGSGPRPAGATPRLGKPLSCELGNVTPWIVVPGRYTAAALRSQADMVAASIVHNGSCNCIATKCVVTCEAWPQRAEFLAHVERRLETAPARPAWYPGAGAAWEQAVGRAAPADGRLPWAFRTGVDPAREPHWLAREWFAPVAVELPLAADGIDAFCGHAGDLVRRLPGSLAASVTVPDGLAAAERRRVELLLGHLPCGVVAVNTWSALGYALANVPWGGFPGGTLAEPKSGLGHVHDPLLLPLVHNTILRAPLVLRPTPPWLPWNPRGLALSSGLLDFYAARARGRPGLWPLLRMLPHVLAG